MLVLILKTIISILILIAIAMYMFVSQSYHDTVGIILVVLGLILFSLGVIPNFGFKHTINRAELYGALVLITGWLIVTNSRILEILLLLAK
jgi:Na+/phosphate symporter